MEILDRDGHMRKVRYVDIGARDDPYPIVMLAGTGQTIDTFGPHIRAFSRTRRLIIPELRCQGATELLSQFGSIDQQVRDLRDILSNLGIISATAAQQLSQSAAVLRSTAAALPRNPVGIPTVTAPPMPPAPGSAIDLVGFSFGGRVALSVAAHLPGMVRKLSLTGVPLKRPALGNMIMKSWLHSLQAKELTSAFWSFILNGYSEPFIDRYRDRLHTFVDNVAKANPSTDKLVDLLAHVVTHQNAAPKTLPVNAGSTGVAAAVDNDDDLSRFSIESCAAMVRCPTQIISGSEDRIAGTVPVKQLADMIAAHHEKRRRHHAARQRMMPPSPHSQYYHHQHLPQHQHQQYANANNGNGNGSSTQQHFLQPFPLSRLYPQSSYHHEQYSHLHYQHNPAELHVDYVEMGGGHLVPFEDPVVWRNLVLDFVHRDIAPACAASDAEVNSNLTFVNTAHRLVGVTAAAANTVVPTAGIVPGQDLVVSLATQQQLQQHVPMQMPMQMAVQEHGESARCVSAALSM